MGEVQTSENMTSRGLVVTIVELEKDNLWLLLQRQALQEKSEDKDEDKPKALRETICLRIGKAGCPKRWCQSMVVVLMVERASKGEEVGHSYTPSLVCPCSSVAPV